MPMLQERRTAIREEISESETPAELEAIVRHWDREYREAIEDPEIMGWVDKRRVELAALPPVVEDPDEKLHELMMELDKLKQREARANRSPVQRASRKYRLLKSEVTWSTKPQVLAVMHIISAHAKPGDVLDEEDIVHMMIANESILKTRQGGKRIWDYYKGNHDEGLLLHGNLERV